MFVLAVFSMDKQIAMGFGIERTHKLIKRRSLIYAEKKIMSISIVMTKDH